MESRRGGLEGREFKHVQSIIESMRWKEAFSGPNKIFKCTLKRDVNANKHNISRSNGTIGDTENTTHHEIKMTRTGVKEERTNERISVQAVANAMESVCRNPGGQEGSEQAASWDPSRDASKARV